MCIATLFLVAYLFTYCDDLYRHKYSFIVVTFICCHKKPLVMETNGEVVTTIYH